MGNVITITTTTKKKKKKKYHLGRSAASGGEAKNAAFSPNAAKVKL
jgi:hypothetical protein